MVGIEFVCSPFHWKLYRPNAVFLLCTFIGLQLNFLVIWGTIKCLFPYRTIFMYDGNYHFRNFAAFLIPLCQKYSGLWGGGLCGFFWLSLTAFVFPQNTFDYLTVKLYLFPFSIPHRFQSKNFIQKRIGQTYTPTVAQLLFSSFPYLFIWLQIDFFIWLSIFALKSSSIRSCRREMLSLISFMLNPKWMCIILCTKKRKKQTWWDICVDMETELFLRSNNLWNFELF